MNAPKQKQDDDRDLSDDLGGDLNDACQGAPLPGRYSVAAAGGPAERVAFLDWVGHLVHQHRAFLAHIAIGEGLGADEAFDAVQEAFQTFITLPRSRALVEEATLSRQLLVTITRNVARNGRRLHAVARPHLSDVETIEGLAASTASVEELLAAAQEQVRLAGCMRTLAEIPRAVVTLRMLDQVAGADVARLVGITPGHVAVVLNRAKSTLLACMTADAPPGR